MARNTRQWLIWLPLLIVFVLLVAGCNSGSY
jgi:hypothetical protein